MALYIGDWIDLFDNLTFPFHSCILCSQPQLTFYISQCLAALSWDKSSDTQKVMHFTFPMCLEETEVEELGSLHAHQHPP